MGSSSRFGRRITARAGALVAAVVVATTLGAAPAAADPTGTIEGFVTDAQGTPLGGICVLAEGGPSVMTGPDGGFTLADVDTGSYRVRYEDCTAGKYATAWFPGVGPRDDAQMILVQTGETTMADVTLPLAATITGTVTDHTGTPLENVCVLPATDDALLGMAPTEADGTYAITKLYPMDVRVAFVDCMEERPYASEFWKDAASWDAATVLALQPGEAVSGIDAALDPAGHIRGRVTNEEGEPLEDVCVTAVTDTFASPGAITDDEGEYLVELTAAGDYRVQFVDCSDAPAYAGEHHPDPIPVVPGQVVEDVDAVLAPGAPATISGRVTNVRGVPMDTACVIAFLPDQYGEAQPVGADGTYTITNLGSGSYYVAFFDCEEGGLVIDPDTGERTYTSAWVGNVPVTYTDALEGPDPVAAGSPPVALAPGEARTGLDHCFGCDAIIVTGHEVGPGSVTVSFTTDLLAGTAPGDPLVDALVGAAAAAGFDGLGASGAPSAGDAPWAVLAYEVACTPQGGGTAVAAAGSPGTPVTVSGLAAGTYSCGVSATSDGVLVATSAVVADVAVPSGTAATPQAGAAPAAAIATTGPTSAWWLAPIGALALALGGTLTVVARRRERSERMAA